MISVIVPVFNEEKNIAPLVGELGLVLKKIGGTFEVIIVDDGSSDATFQELSRIAKSTEWLKVIRFYRNFGQTAAFAAGISASIGDIIVTIDGDLENDPADIPKMLEFLHNGYDLVSGWRKKRWQESTFSRKIPSRVANWLISFISGVKLHDYGCMLKAYRREVITDIVLYGEMHRFIPAYVHRNGAKIVEMEVNYRSRRFGVSKYGFSRTFRVLLDLFFIKFMLQYMNRPIHFFGGIGFASFFLGLIAGIWAIILKLTGVHTFVSTPLPTFTALFIIVGVQLIVIGVLAEMVMRTYYESQNKTPFKIKERINFS